MKGKSMTTGQIIGILTFLIIGFLVISGCISPGLPTTVPETTTPPQKVNIKTTVSVTTVPITTHRTIQEGTVQHLTNPTTVPPKSLEQSQFDEYLLRSVCQLEGNGGEISQEIRITEAGIQTFEMKYLRGHPFYIGLFKNKYENLIRWLSYEPISEEYKAVCWPEPDDIGYYGRLEYGSYKEDYVWVNTSEFLEVGDYYISVEACGPWSIEISHCHATDALRRTGGYTYRYY